MGDIEAMFYQVLIPEYQQNMLKFLWWEGNNFHNQPTDHQICVYIFGGPSPPSCCNYVLKRTAIDNEIQFGPEAAKALMNNLLC